MSLTFFPFGLYLLGKLIIDLCGTVLRLSNLMSFLLENVELFDQVGQFFFQIKFSLVIEDLVSFMATFHIQHHFLFHHSYLQQCLLSLKLIFKDGCLALGLSNLILIFILENIQFLNFFLS